MYKPNGFISFVQNDSAEKSMDMIEELIRDFYITTENQLPEPYIKSERLRHYRMHFKNSGPAKDKCSLYICLMQYGEKKQKEKTTIYEDNFRQDNPFLEQMVIGQFNGYIDKKKYDRIGRIHRELFFSYISKKPEYKKSDIKIL